MKIKKTFNKILHFLNPPKVGDEYVCNPMLHISTDSLSVEAVLFGLTDIYGNTVWVPEINKEAYKLVIIDNSDQKFECEAQLLCTNGIRQTWRKRAHNRNIRKEYLDKMIKEGLFKKV